MHIHKARKVNNMKRVQQFALLGILAFGGMAQAQNRNGNNRNDGFRDNDRNDDRYDQRGNGNRFDIIDRSQVDLNRLSRTRLDSRDFNRVVEITRNLQQFEARMSQGRFDKDRLDRIIETMNNLANSNRIPQAARLTLFRDVDDLRVFRANRGNSGLSRNNGYPF
jgi:hypothetical protein